MSSCQPDRISDHAIISGQFNGAEGKKIYVEELETGRMIRVDSAVVDNLGKFNFSVLPSEKSFYLLQVPDYPAVPLVLDIRDSVKIIADTNNLKLNYLVSGNSGSVILQQNYHQTGLTKSILDSLKNVLFEKQQEENFPSIKASLDSTLEATLDRHYAHTKRLIIENPDEVATLLLINSSVSGQQIFTLEKDAQLYLEIEKNLIMKYPENSHVKAHARRMDAWRKQSKNAEEVEARFGIGKKIPALQLPDINGVEKSPEEFKGKNVILMFWASYSPECRADIQLLKSLYKKKEEFNFEVFAVSLDHNKKFWKAAVNLENMGWINVSDLAGWQSPVVKLFNLKDELPFYFLIDEQGRIALKSHDFSEVRKSLESRSD
jgi:peroxiredoxin